MRARRWWIAGPAIWLGAWAPAGCGSSENDAALKAQPGQPATDVPATQDEYDRKFQGSGVEPPAPPPGR